MDNPFKRSEAAAAREPTAGELVDNPFEIQNPFEPEGLQVNPFVMGTGGVGEGVQAPNLPVPAPRESNGFWDDLLTQTALIGQDWKRAVGGALEIWGTYEKPEEGMAAALDRLKQLREEPEKQNGLQQIVGQYSNLMTLVNELKNKQLGKLVPDGVAQWWEEIAAPSIRETGEEMRAEAAKEIAKAPPLTRDNPLSYYGAGGVRFVGGSLAPALAASVIFKNPSVGVAVITGQVYADKTAEELEKGRPLAEAAMTGTAYALAEGLPSAIPLVKALREGVGFWKKVGGVALAESGQEIVTEALQMGWDKGILNEDMTLKEALWRIADAGIFGAVGGAVVGAGAYPFTRSGDADLNAGLDTKIEDVTQEELDQISREEAAAEGMDVAEGQQLELPLEDANAAAGAESTLTQESEVDNLTVEVEDPGATIEVPEVKVAPIAPQSPLRRKLEKMRDRLLEEAFGKFSKLERRGKEDLTPLTEEAKAITAPQRVWNTLENHPDTTPDTMRFAEQEAVLVEEGRQGKLKDLVKEAKPGAIIETNPLADQLELMEAETDKQLQDFARAVQRDDPMYYAEFGLNDVTNVMTEAELAKYKTAKTPRRILQATLAQKKAELKRRKADRRALAEGRNKQQERARAVVRRVLRRLVKEFAPDTKVVIVDPRLPGAKFEPAAMGMMYSDVPADVAAIGLNTAELEYTTDGTVLYEGKPLAVSILAHEFGHFIFKTKWRQASPAVRRAIYNDYRRWLNKIGRLDDVKRYDASFKSASSLDVSSTAEGSLVDELNAVENPYYWTSFDEYAAEQVAKYVEGEIARASDSKLVAFWRGVADAFRGLYDRLLKIGYNKKDLKVAPAFKEWLDLLRKQAALERLDEVLGGRTWTSNSSLENPNPTLASTNPQEVKDNIDTTMKAIYRRTKGEKGSVDTDRLSRDVSRFNKFMELGLTLTQIERENPDTPGLSRYVEGVRNWWTEKTAWAEVANERLIEWRKLGKEQTHNFAKFVHEVTLVSDSKGRRLTPEEMSELAGKYKLSPEAKELYRKLDYDFSAAIDTLEEVVRKDAFRRWKDDPDMLQEQLEIIAKEFNALKARNFFPLSRFGEHYVVARAKKPMKVDGRVLKEGEIFTFEMYESDGQAAARRAKLMKAFPDLNVGKGVVPQETLSFIGMPPQLVERFKNELELTPEQLETFDMILHAMAPGQSWKNRLQRRKGTAGFSLDAMRGYAAYFMNFGNYISRVNNYAELQDAMLTVRKYGQALRHSGEDARATDQLYNYLQEHYAYAMNPGDEWANLRAAGFIYYLGFLPKSALVNLTQVPMVALPHLAAIYGDARAAKQLSSSIMRIRKLWTTGKGLSWDTVKALKAGIDAGFLNESLATEVGAVAEGSNLQRLLPGSFLKSEAAARTIRTASYYGAWLFQKAEQVNRYIVFDAAYQLEKSRLLKGRRFEGLDPGEQDRIYEQAYVKARTAIESTQFEYARWNRPKFMRGKWSTIFLFKQYLQNMLYFIVRDPGNSRFLLMMLLLAGAQGMPGAEDIVALLNAALTKGKEALGLKNPKVDLWVEARKFLQELDVNPDLVLHGVSRYSFGAVQLGEMVGVGVPSFDLSGSLSLGNVVPGVEPAVRLLSGQSRDRYRDAAKFVEEWAGPLGALAMNVMQVVGNDDPRALRKVEQAAPSIVKSIMKGTRLIQEGADTGRSGEKIVEFDVEDPIQLAEAVGQMLGFAPTRLTKAREEGWMQMQYAQYYMQRRGMLMEQFDMAIETKDREAIADVKRAIRKFNRSVPWKLKIPYDSLLTSRKGRERRRWLLEKGRSPQPGVAPYFKEVQETFQ